MLLNGIVAAEMHLLCLYERAVWRGCVSMGADWLLVADVFVMRTLGCVHGGLPTPHCRLVRVPARALRAGLGCG